MYGGFDEEPSGSNPGGGCENLGGNRETRGGGDGFEGLDGQLFIVKISRKDGASLSSDDEDEEEEAEEEETLFPLSLVGFLKISKGFMTHSWSVNLASGTMA
nr:hypothetical protein [Tanacetum cinerariifolium]